MSVSGPICARTSSMACCKPDIFVAKITRSAGSPLARLHNVVVFLLAVDDKALAADPLRTRTACDDTQIVAEHRLQPVREICADGSEADQRDCFDLLHGSVSFAVAAQTSSRSRYLGYFTTN